MLTKTQLMNVMKYHLINFNNEQVSIDDSTIHNSVLSNDDFGGVNEASLYRHFVMYSLNRAGNSLKQWPGNWLTLSVTDVADSII